MTEREKKMAEVKSRQLAIDSRVCLDVEDIPMLIAQTLNIPWFITEVTNLEDELKEAKGHVEFLLAGLAAIQKSMTLPATVFFVLVQQVCGRAANISAEEATELMRLEKEKQAEERSDKGEEGP